MTPPKITGQIKNRKYVERRLYRPNKFEIALTMPGKMLSFRNRMNFFSNMKKLLDATPRESGIIVNIFRQPLSNDPTSLHLLNFCSDFSGIFGGKIPREFTLLVRVSGGPRNSMKSVLNIIAEALRDEKFLLRESHFDIIEKNEISGYTRRLSHVRPKKEYYEDFMPPKRSTKEIIKEVNDGPVSVEAPESTEDPGGAEGSI
jgi:hypothetical protein